MPNRSECEIMIPRGEWKRLHSLIQEEEGLTRENLKARIEIGPDAIVVRFESAESSLELKLRYL